MSIGMDSMKIHDKLCRWFFGLFYDREYLNGKWFNENTGWGWAVRGLLFQKILGINRNVPFPVSSSMKISENPIIDFHPDDIDIFQHHGTFFQCNPGAIVLGKGTRVGYNVGIITQYYNPQNVDELLPAEDVIIGWNCRIGMNSVIMPGVILGENTVVGAGSIVTHSFPDGNCTIAGVPAIVIR